MITTPLVSGGQGGGHGRLVARESLVLPTLVESVVVASAGLLSVGSITIVLLLLTSEQGGRTGLAYAAGYLGGCTAIGAAALAIGFQTADGPSRTGRVVRSVLLLALAALLLWMAQRNWRRRGTSSGEQPRLLTLVDRMTPVRALALGAAVTVVNVKNLAILLSAVSVVIVSGLAGSTKMLIVVLDALVFSAAVLIPVAVYVSSPARARERLGGMHRLLRKHGRTIGVWVPTVFGTVFLVQGLRGLS